MGQLKIFPVIICGGIGSRLWPLSRKSYPKQFLNILGNSSKTMLQQTQERINDFEGLEKPIIICNKEHRFLVAEQMRSIGIDPFAIILEPIGKNTAPAITLAALKIKEKYFSYRWIAMIITFAGALILIRPDFSNLYVEPVALVSIFGAICLGLEAIFIKLLTKYEKNTQILLINNFIGLILSSLIVIFFWQTPTFLQLLFCILIGFLMICAQICFLIALRSNQLNFVIPFFYSTLIFVLLYDYLIFRELPDFLSLSGSLLIILIARPPKTYEGLITIGN